MLCSNLWKIKPLCLQNSWCLILESYCGEEVASVPTVDSRGCSVSGVWGQPYWQSCHLLSCFYESLGSPCTNSFLTLHGHIPSLCHVKWHFSKSNSPKQGDDGQSCPSVESRMVSHQKLCSSYKPTAEWVTEPGGHLEAKTWVFPSFLPTSEKIFWWLIFHLVIEVYQSWHANHRFLGLTENETCK